LGRHVRIEDNKSRKFLPVRQRTDREGLRDNRNDERGAPCGRTDEWPASEGGRYKRLSNQARRVVNGVAHCGGVGSAVYSRHKRASWDDGE
jgi:hypothetical protein